MILVYYLIIMNALAFIIYGIDKKKAEKEKYRISESTLILVAVLGGALGAWLGMLVFHHKTRKKKFKIVPVFLVIYIVLSGLFLYGNYHLVTTEYEYRSGKISEEMDGKTIVQISDLHNQLFGINQSILLDRIKKCNPDIIVVTGDVVDTTHTSYGIAEQFFKGAVEIAPVYYISGNHEKWLSEMKKDKHEHFLKAVEDYGVKYLDDEVDHIQGITLVGVADESLGEDIGALIDSDVLGNVTNDEPIVVLMHEPEYIDSCTGSGADLVLSGHNHGGQINIPGKGGLISAGLDFFPDLYEGVHTFGDTTMIISRGLGNSIFPVRINNDPEIVKVVLRKEK